MGAYRDGFQSYSTDSELDQIVGRNSGYDMPDPWEEPVGIFLKQRERTHYVTFQDIYGALDIPAVRQSSENAKRIQQIATDCGWVQTRRRVGTSSERVRAFFPDHVDKVHKRVNGCPGRPGHYVETLSIHTPIPTSFLQLFGKRVGQVGQHHRFLIQ